MNQTTAMPGASQRLSYIRELSAEIDVIKNIIKRKQSDATRPLIIEFCGSPRSGKTSCLSSLEIFLVRNDIRVKIVSEKAPICPIDDKSSPSYNIWNTLQMICEVEEILSQKEGYDIILLDRGLFDSLFWSYWHFSAHRMSTQEYDAFNSFITMVEWRRLVQIAFIFKCDPQVSMDREYSTLLTNKQGNIVNRPNLKKYLNAIDTVTKRFAREFRQLDEIDTSRMLQNDVSFEVTKKILKSLKHLLDEHVAVVERAHLKAELINEPTSFNKFFTEKASKAFKFLPRAEAEENSMYVQLVPTMFVKDKESNGFFSAGKRDERASPAEKQKMVFQFGGHARDTDMHVGDSLLQVLKNALCREIKEELGLIWRPRDNDPLCIWNNDSSRSEQHVAICFLNEVDRDTFRPRLGSEFVSRGERSATWSGAQDIDPDKIDSWSLLYLSQKLGSNVDWRKHLHARQSILDI